MPMKILIINPFGIGDVIFSFPMIEAIREAHPDCEVHMVCNERTHEIIALNPSVQKSIIFNRDRMRSLLKHDLLGFVRKAKELMAVIKKEKYDACLDLSMGREYALVMMLLGIQKRVGLDFKSRGRFLTDKISILGFDFKSVREYYMDVAKAWSSKVEDTIVYPTLTRPLAQIRGYDKYIVVAPGGGKSWGKEAHFKQWPPDRFAAVVKRLASDLSAKIVILGDDDEKALCESMTGQDACPDATLWIGKSLTEVMSILQGATLFVGNDGGLLHLANVLHTPVVGIYGPVNEKVYGPLPGSEHAVITEPVECRPCYARFRFPRCAYDKRCLTQISVDRVFDAAMLLCGTQTKEKSYGK